MNGHNHEDKKEVKLDAHKQSLLRMWVESGRDAKRAPIYLDHKYVKVPMGNLNRYGKPEYARDEKGNYKTEAVEVVCWHNRHERRAALKAMSKQLRNTSTPSVAKFSEKETTNE